jgi:hypothetical protein
MTLVAILTLLIPETKGTTLEDIENDKLFMSQALRNVEPEVVQQIEAPDLKSRA